MSILSEKAVEKGLELLQTASDLATDQAPKLLDEYLNLMIFEALLGLVPGILIVIVTYIAVKWCNALIMLQKENLKEKKDNKCEHGDKLYSHRIDTNKDNLVFFQCLRMTIIIGSAVFSTYLLIPTVRNVGRIVIAPKIVLLQEGASFLKSIKENRINSK